MKVLLGKSTLIFTSFIIILLAYASISDAKIDSKTLEGVWLFNEGEGDVVKDSSGKGYDGEINGAKWADGKFGKALEFDGVDDYVVIKNYFGVGGKDPRTTCLWFKGSEIREHSWVKWGIVQNEKKYYIRAHPDGTLRVEVAGGQSYGSTNVCDGEWHHLTVVFPDGSDSVKDHNLYVDGVPEENPQGGDIAMDTENKTTEVHIGHPLGQHAYAKGIIDEVAIFDVALTEDDIKTIMAEGFKAALAVEDTDKLTTTWATIKSQY